MAEATILYLSYTGLLEPLGQSQVLNYLEKLADDNEIRLITFEKPDDLNEWDEFERLKERCMAANIQWQPLKYHRSLRAIATLYDIFKGIKEARKICRQQPDTVIHARGYIPAFMGMFLKKQYNAKLIFDMRAFWPDEMITAGRLKKDSMVYKFLKKWERRCLQRADHIVTLTKAAEKYLCAKYKESGMNERITTVPTCVNMELFTINTNRTSLNKNNNFVMGSVGTVTGWFKIDWLLEFYKALSNRIPSSVLRFITKDPPEFIKSTAARKNINQDALKISSCRFREVPQKMQKMTIGSFFFEPGFSKLGSSPTRMGEFLACGVPCVANPGVGDVAHIINKYEVGVLVENDSETPMQQGVQELQELLKDPQLKQRCRHAAEDWFSLEKGVEKYREIYDRLV